MDEISFRMKFSYLLLIPHSLRPVPTSQGEFESHNKTFLPCWASCVFLRETLCLRRLWPDQARHSPWGSTITHRLVAHWVRFCSWNAKILPSARGVSISLISSTWRSALYLAEEWEIFCSCVNERKILKKCSRKLSVMLISRKLWLPVPISPNN